MRILRGLFIISAMLSFTGCATYNNGLSQNIEIRTAGVDNVTCDIGNDKYSYELIAPGTVRVERDSEELKIVCKRAGYVDVHKTIEPVNNLGKAVLGNLYNGILPGLVYDMATSSSYAFPDLVIVDMRRDFDRYIIDRTASYVMPKRDYYDFERVYYKPSDVEIDKDTQNKNEVIRAMRNSVVK